MYTRETSKECLWTSLSLVENACTKNVSCAESNKSISAENCRFQQGALLVTGIFLWTKNDLLANESCLLDRRQGLYRDVIWKNAQICHTPLQNRTSTWRNTKKHLLIYTNTPHKNMHMHRNETCSLLEMWCNIVSVSSAYDSVRAWCPCSTVQLNAIQCSWTQYTVERTNVS